MSGKLGRREAAALFAILALLSAAVGTLVTTATTGADAQAATSVSIGFAGDTGANSNTAAVANAARTSGVSAFFNLGDFSYSQITPESGWCDFITQHVGTSMSYELISGNHEDQDGPDGLWSNFRQCLPDKLGSTGDYARQYYVDYPASQPVVRFIMLSPKLTFSEGSTYWSYKVGTQGYNFASSAIDGARSAGIPFVAVGMHMYCLSMVNYPCAASPDLMNLIVSKKVDLYLQAHDHGYARSKQLALNTSCTAIPTGSFNPACVADADPSSNYTAGKGTVLATVGPGGRSLNQENNTTTAPYFQTYMGTNNNPTYGFLKVDITDTTLTGTFVRGSGGTYTDKFTITRNATASPSPTATASPTPTDTASPTPTDTGSPSPSSTPSTVTLSPIADSWVGSDLPTTNHGSETSLYVDSSPTKRTFLKFDLSSLAGKTVTGAQLKVTTTSGTSSGSPDTQEIRSVADSSWTESGLIYNNQPAIGSSLATLSSTASNTTYTINLPVAAVQSGVGGPYSLAIDSAGGAGDAFYVNSKEGSAATPPQLVLTTN